MNVPRSGGASKRAVPTLTEVLKEKAEADVVPAETLAVLASAGDGAIALDLNLDEAPTAAAGTTIMLPDGSLAEARAHAPEPLGDGSPHRVTERVLVEIQRHVDLMLEYRLRETLTPALARMTDMFIRDTRNELAQTLREIVSRAVEAELARESNRTRRD